MDLYVRKQENQFLRLIFPNIDSKQVVWMKGEKIRRWQYDKKLD